MIDKFCTYLVNKIKTKIPDIDSEKELVIDFGIRLLVGEVPKIFILISIGFLLEIGWYTIFAFLILLPYRSASGGFHMKTHLGCMMCTIILYCGSVKLSIITQFSPYYLKYIVIMLVWIFGIAMVKKYAPADTENIPILSKKERKRKKALSYITLTITLLLATFVQDRVISNILVYETIFQSISITKIAYKITNNKYGYEVYNIQKT